MQYKSPYRKNHKNLKIHVFFFSDATIKPIINNLINEHNNVAVAKHWYTKFNIRHYFH